MKIHCTRPNCSNPENWITGLDEKTLKTEQQVFCTTCGMPLMLDGRYFPERLLAQGGFGAAFLARDRRSPAFRKCVVKQFQPSSDFNSSQLETAQQLFEREAIVLDRLGNENSQIPSLLAYLSLEAPDWESSRDQQFFYIVQEYIDGQDLEAELETQEQFSEEQVREVLQEMLKILEFVHDQEVIHRDIKPSNVMRDRKGRLYLLDFGAVKQVTQQAKNTGKSTGIYSMGYAPPEQMRGHNVFPSTDLYALAITCIVLLTGKEPEDLFDNHNDRWHWRHQAQVSDTLADIFDRMLQPTPSDRFGSASQVLKALNPPHAVTNIAVSQSDPAMSISTQPQYQADISMAPTPFSIAKHLIGAALTGFEAGLLEITSSSLLDSIPLVALITGGTVGGLVFAQYRHWLKKTDLLIIVGVTLLAIIFLPILRIEINLIFVFIFSTLIALVFVSAIALFRLVYLMFYRFM